MKDVTIVVPSNGNLDALPGLINSLNNHTEDKSKVLVRLIDNCNTNRVDLRPMSELFQMRCSFLKLPTRCGLTSVYNMGFLLSETNWVIYANEDVVFEKGWQSEFSRLTTENSHQIFLLCKPYNWSGFAISKNFFEENGPFNEDYPEGCYEDDELYLNLAHKHRFTKKDDIYTKVIYCMDYIEGRGLIKHVPNRESSYWKRWDSDKNLKVFSKLWTTCNPDYPGAIENKDGTYYRKNYGQP